MTDEKEPLPPSPYGAGPPYPNPTDRVYVVVYYLETGEIKQRSCCSLEDMHRQNAAFDNCGYVEVTGADIGPETHVVDLATGTIKPRTTPTAGQLSLQALAEWDAVRAVRDAKIDALLKSTSV